jgi:hypothetical protein
MLTNPRHVMHIAIHPLGGQTLTTVPFMSGLSARFAPCRLTRRRLSPWRIGTGRLVGIGGVLIEFGFKFLDLALKITHLLFKLADAR